MFVISIKYFDLKMSCNFVINFVKNYLVYILLSPLSGANSKVYLNKSITESQLNYRLYYISYSVFYRCK